MSYTLTCALLLVAAHFVLLMAFFEPAISTPDANGYFAQARLIATKQQTWFETDSPIQYLPPHWLTTDGKRYYSKYPPGLPLIAATAWRLGGPTTALMVNPIMASLSLLGLFLLCKNWIGDGWALLAAALAALNPVTNEQALWAFGHTAVGFFMVWGLFCLAKWVKACSPTYAFAAGFCFGIIPTIRYAEALLGLAALVFVALHLKANPRCARSVLVGLIGACIPITALCIRNHAAFGAAWKTGYSLTNEQTGFGWFYFKDHALPYLQQLLAEGSGLALGLGLVGMAVLCSRRATWKRGLLLAMLVVPTTLLYMAYYFPPDGASMRFLVFTLFVYPIAGVWLLKLLAVHHRRPAWAGAITLLLLTVGWGLPPAVQAMERQERANGFLARTAGVLKEYVEPGSIVIADGLIQQHLDFLGGWRLVDGAVLSQNRRRALPPPTEHDGAPGPGEGRRANHGRAQYGNINDDDLVDAFAADVWRWADSLAAVYWMTSEDDVEQIERRFAGYGTLTQIARVDYPNRPSRSERTRSRRGLAPPGRPPGRHGRPGPPGRLGRQQPHGGGIPRRLGSDQGPDSLILLEWTRDAESMPIRSPSTE